MTIYFATDHAGFELKNSILAYVRDELGYTVVDCGATLYNAEDDYPEFIQKAAEAVSVNPEDARALIFGGSGQGEAMVANKLPHVRATVYYGSVPEIVTLSREHNNANVLSFGARFVSEADAKEATRVWLGTSFSGEERHVRRLTMF